MADKEVVYNDEVAKAIINGTPLYHERSDDGWGQTTDLRNLPDGTWFHVLNGNYVGYVFSQDGNKYMHIKDINEDKILTGKEDLVIDRTWREVMRGKEIVTTGLVSEDPEWGLGRAGIAAFLMSKLSYSDFIGDNISAEASECTARVYFSCKDKDIAKKVFGWNCDDHAIGIVLGLIVNPLTDKEPRLCEDDDVRIAPVFESRIPFPAPWGTEWKTSDPKVFLTYGDWMPQNILSPDDIQRLRDIGVEHCKASIEEIRQRFISWKMEQGWHFGIGR